MTFQAYLDRRAAAAVILLAENYYNAIAAPAMQNFHE
jgi:hypothetical protein